MAEGYNKVIPMIGGTRRGRGSCLGESGRGWEAGSQVRSDVSRLRNQVWQGLRLPRYLDPVPGFVHRKGGPVRQFRR